MVIFGFLHALFCAQYNSTSYTIDAICMATVHSSDNIGDQYTMKTHTCSSGKMQPESINVANSRRNVADIIKIAGYVSTITHQLPPISISIFCCTRVIMDAANLGKVEVPSKQISTLSQGPFKTFTSHVYNLLSQHIYLKPHYIACA